MLNFKSFSSQDTDNECKPKPYCNCWNKRTPRLWTKLDACTCGEDLDMKEWRWEQQSEEALGGQSTQVVISPDGRQVTFHPYYSSGTALVRGDTPLLRDHHYYWEVKMLTEPYGTDIMIGVGTERVSALVLESQFKFRSVLGEDAESYGLSYSGRVSHGGRGARLTAGFTRGSIAGVKLDLWAGTIEFFLNREPQGVVFYNARRHGSLYPMLSSTAAQSTLRLTYAASWRASLLVDAARALARAARAATAAPSPGRRRELARIARLGRAVGPGSRRQLARAASAAHNLAAAPDSASAVAGSCAAADSSSAAADTSSSEPAVTALPPGLYRSMRTRFWIMMPSDDGFLDDEVEEPWKANPASSLQSTVVTGGVPTPRTFWELVATP